MSLESLNLNLNTNTQVILSIAFILFIAFLATRITKRLKLPNVTGYILVGILIGPHMLNLIPANIFSGMEFVADIALAFIAFGVGRYLRLSTIRGNKTQVLVITLAESLMSATLITLSMYFIFKIPLSLSVMLGAIASATAPASTIMTIRQYKARGTYVDTLLQVVALDDALALIAFSICAAVIQALSGDRALGIGVFVIPILANLFTIGLGIAFGFLLNRMISDRRTDDNRLILAVATISVLAGVCAALDVSPLLACMALGTAYVNISGSRRLFDQVNDFAPVILTMFFVLSGMRLNVPALATTGIIGMAYFFIRIIGKYLGVYIGATISKAPIEVKKYLGLALIPQASVSIGLAVLGQRILPPDLGSLLSTIVLSSAVLYEMVGPASGKFALQLSGSIPEDTGDAKEQEDVSPSELTQIPG